MDPLHADMTTDGEWLLLKRKTVTEVLEWLELNWTCMTTWRESFVCMYRGDNN